MTDTLPKEYYLVSVPSGLDTERSVEYIEKRFSKCLQRQQDDIILNMESVDSIERNHTNLLTKWIRNLKSLHGSLLIIGIHADVMPLFKTSRLTSICEVFDSMEALKLKYPDLTIIASDKDTDKIPIVPSTTAKDHKIEEPPSEKAPESVTPIKDEPPLPTSKAQEPLPQKFKDSITEVADDIDHILDEEGLMGDDPDPVPSGSITQSINIEELEEMASEDDISDKLDFLQNSPTDNEPEDVISTEQPTLVETEPVDEESDVDDENDTHEPSDQEDDSTEDSDTSEVRSSEAYYNIMGDTAEGETGLEDSLLDELDDVSVDEELFTEDDEQSEQSEEPEEVEVSETDEPEADLNPTESDNENLPSEESIDSLDVEKEEESPEKQEEYDEKESDDVSEVRTTEAYYNIMGDSAEGEGSLENELLDSLDDVSVDDSLFDDNEEQQPDDPALSSEGGAGSVEVEESVSEQMDSSNHTGEPDDVEEIVPPSAKSFKKEETLVDAPYEKRPVKSDKPSIEGPPEESEIEEDGEYIDAPLGVINEIIQLSGEYQCLGCGELEYFLKGFKFHACRHQGCSGPADGFHPVCVLF